MCKQKIYNKEFHCNQRRVIFHAVSIMIFLLLLTSAQSAAGKELTGIVKEMPGIGWPFGVWYLEDKRIVITEETVFKGDQSKAKFGAKVTVKGSRVDGVFTVYEVEVRTEDSPVFAGN